MKNIEQILKESLENHELPYDEAAWESLSKRLDGSTPSPFYRKWWVAASVGTVLVGSALFFTLNSQSESSKNTKETTPVITQNTTTPQTGSQTENRLNTTNNANPQTNTHQSEEHLNPGTQSTPIDHTNYQNTEVTQVAQNSKDASSQKSGANQNNIPFTVKNTQNENNGPKEVAYLPVILDQTNLCIGDEIEITNPNETLPISVIQNNRTQIIKAGSKRTFTANSEGVIEVVSGKNTQTITVNKPSDKLYISADQTILYNDGVPSIEFNVSGAENAVQWSVEKYHSEVQNGNLIVHPYIGKEITVKATSKDLNGCTVSETKTISIKEEYNLQAANSFNINSSDSRNNKFMPYALTERNTAFELTILDAKSGRVLYKTNDASNGWDGTDMQTGSLAQVNSTYIWRVMMKNPLPGEPKVYNGTIVLLNN
ncbi:hypothetical protein [Fluviicola sp.]|uniref:hypothetical protein n=1 Tax=Fluviicola sp. TaxID=1917219 RepID=UPI0031CDFAAA